MKAIERLSVVLLTLAVGLFAVGVGFWLVAAEARKKDEPGYHDSGHQSANSPPNR
jgi:hypothetical protein